MTLWIVRRHSRTTSQRLVAALRDCKADSNLRVESRTKMGRDPLVAIHVKRAFVIGHPIAHSRSPLIHGYWLNHYGIEGSYEAIDVTPEALEPLFAKRMEGFSILFHQYSATTVGTSTIQSRATGGLIGETLVFVLPGSRGACRDAWEGILRLQLDNRHLPCNFVEIMPRFMER